VSVSIHRPAAEVDKFVVEPADLPRWAAALSGSVEQGEDRWFADSPMGRVEAEFESDVAPVIQDLETLKALLEDR
jgi:uncharacterized membrane protein